MNVIQLIVDGSAFWVHRHADVRYIEQYSRFCIA